MTLIIGAKCIDGLIIGADGAATMVDSMGNHTARQPITKLDIISNNVIVGVSGPVGLGQMIAGEVEDLVNRGTLTNKKPYKAMAELRKQISIPINLELHHCGEAAKCGLGNAALLKAFSQTVVGLPLGEQACLFQFDNTGSPELASEKLPLIAIGGGQQQADPFLAFLKRTFWIDGKLSLADGLFAVLWTLEYVIQGSPGGVAEPKQVIILEKSNTQYHAKELSFEDIQEHFQNITDAEKTLKNWKSFFSERAPATVPTLENIPNKS